jgi:hypothetical protein
MTARVKMEKSDGGHEPLLSTRQDLLICPHSVRETECLEASPSIKQQTEYSENINLHTEHFQPNFVVPNKPTDRGVEEPRNIAEEDIGIKVGQFN